MPTLSQQRERKQVDVTKIGVPRASGEDWKIHQKDMKKDGPTALSHLSESKMIINVGNVTTGDERSGANYLTLIK